MLADIALLGIVTASLASWLLDKVPRGGKVLRSRVPVRPNRDMQQGASGAGLDQRSALLLAGGTEKRESGPGTGIRPWLSFLGRMA